jgi:two-component system response regulator DesR
MMWLRIVEVLRMSHMTPRRVEAQASCELGADLLALHCPEPVGDDLAFIHEVRRKADGCTQLVVICHALNARSLRRSLNLGVAGIVLADVLDETLGPTITAALAGQVVVPRELGWGLRRRPLSFREKQIVGLAVLGYTNSQIGGRLYLAESTVKSHISSSFSKLGVGSRSEAGALLNDPDEPLGLEIIRIARRLDQPGVPSAV